MHHETLLFDSRDLQTHTHKHTYLKLIMNHLSGLERVGGAFGQMISERRLISAGKFWEKVITALHDSACLTVPFPG
jgi:hypothetical protein